MKHAILSLSLISGAISGAANAGGFDPAISDPVVTPPARCWLIEGLLPCSDRVEYIHKGGSSEGLTRPAPERHNSDDCPQEQTHYQSAKEGLTQ